MKKYTIKKGNHYSGLHLGLVCSNELVFGVLFDESADYKTTRVENQYDINKLYGFSDYNSFHHSNSARFGWRWLKGKLELHAYCYANGERKVKYITSLDLNKTYFLSLRISGDKYIFKVDDDYGVVNEVSIDRERHTNRGIKYKLYPYFGGDETAPHNIDIYIKDY